MLFIYMTCHPPPPALVGVERIRYTYTLLNKFFMSSSAQRQYHPYHGLLPVAVVVPSLYQTSCAFKEVNPDTSEEKGAGLTVDA